MSNSERPSEAGSNEAATQALLARQAAALERLALVSDPQYQPKQRLYQKLAGMILGGFGLAAGGYQFVLFMIDSHEQRQLVSNWVLAAREMYDAEGSGKQAFELLEKAKAVDPQDVDVAQLLAYVDGMSVVEDLLNLDRPLNAADVDAYGRAMGQAVLLERVSPESPEWAILRGQLAAAVDEPLRAKEFLDTALRISPGHPFATLRLAQITLALTKQAKSEEEKAKGIKEAAALIDGVLAKDPSNKWAHLWKGVLELEWNHSTDKAIASFKAAIDRDPRFVNAWQSLGSAYDTSDKLADAEAAYTRALQLRPNLSAAYVGLAYVYGKQDRYEIAMMFAKKATDSNPGSLQAWIIRGLLARELCGTMENESPQRAAMLQESVDSYSKALDLNPRSGDVYLERSKLYRLAGKLRESGADARAAVGFSPKDPFAWNALAKYFQAAGFAQEAADTYTKVLELDPNMGKAFMDRATVLLTLGKTEEALVDLDKAAKIATTDFMPDVLVQRGMTLAKLGRHDVALADFVKARTIDPSTVSAWLEESRALRTLGRAADGLVAAKEALKLRPDDASIRTLVTELGAVTPKK
jgi:tetratricopeptide (TPR) repeat protein